LAEKATAEELNRALNLDGEEVQIAGEALTIKAFRLRQLSGVMQCVSELSARGLIERDGERDFNFAKMLLNGGDSLIEILRIATGKELSWVENLDPLEAVTLCKAVWSANLNFFTRNQAELLTALGPLWFLVEKKAAAFGIGHSSSSSAPGTGSKTSQITPSPRSTNSAKR
jgi:hypothetical protein